MRARRPFVRVVAVLLAGAFVTALAPAGAAFADPTPAEVEAQIDKKWQQLEPVIEDYNKVHSALAVSKTNSAALQKKIGPLSLQAELALGRIGAMAAQQYKTGPNVRLNALLGAATTGDLANQLTYLDVLAREQKEQIAGVLAIRDRYAREKRKLDALIAEQARQDAELAARKKQINAEIVALEKSLPPTIVRVAGCPRVATVTTKEATAVKTACAQVGKPYAWGADGPDSFDCSGLTQYAWKAAGVYLTHHAADQWNQGRSVGSPRAGDLVFFYSDLHHVGLYLGSGMMVHAPRAGKPVQVSSTGIMPIAGYRRVD
ncbi:MAG TPA: C40 family peptidase [Asanoa sp.]